MTIIDAKSSRDITVIFEDESIVEHRPYNSFIKGIIEHPKGNFYINHINETRLNSANLKMTITDVKNCDDITVTFEDRSIIKHRTYDSFKKGGIQNPIYPENKKHFPKTTEIGCITRKKITYKTDTCHYYCTCNICQHDDIWNWKEIHGHNAFHGIPKENLIFIEPD